MSKRVRGIAVIAVEPPRKCSECGRHEECRPYGKNGAQICFECMMKTPESKAEAGRQMKRRLFGYVSS